jgi:hypothetical protein
VAQAQQQQVVARLAQQVVARRWRSHVCSKHYGRDIE